MKLIPAKCPNCGSKIKIDLDKKVYTCQYCRYDILLEDSSSQTNAPNSLSKEELLEQQKKFGKFALIPLIIFGIIFVIIFIMIFSTILNNFGSVNDAVTPDNTPNIPEPQEPEITTHQFNAFIDRNGVEMAGSVGSILNFVISNMEETSKVITVSYNGVETTNITDIKNIIIEVELDSFSKYKVLTEKDNEGYVNKVIISEV